MSEMRFIPLDPALLAAIAPRDPGMIGMLDDPGAATRACALGWGMIDGGYTIGGGGVLPQWRGRAIAWLAPSIFARPRHLAIAARFAVKWFDTLQEHDEFRRIEAVVPLTDMRRCRFLSRLGFLPEGPKWRYGPDGLDYYEYSRVRA